VEQKIISTLSTFEKSGAKKCKRLSKNDRARGKI